MSEATKYEIAGHTWTIAPAQYGRARLELSGADDFEAYGDTRAELLLDALARVEELVRKAAQRTRVAQVILESSGPRRDPDYRGRGDAARDAAELASDAHEASYFAHTALEAIGKLITAGAFVDSVHAERATAADFAHAGFRGPAFDTVGGGDAR